MARCAYTYLHPSIHINIRQSTVTGQRTPTACLQFTMEWKRALLSSGGRDDGSTLLYMGGSQPQTGPLRPQGISLGEEA